MPRSLNQITHRESVRRETPYKALTCSWEKPKSKAFMAMLRTYPRCLGAALAATSSSASEQFSPLGMFG